MQNNMETGRIKQGIINDEKFGNAGKKRGNGQKKCRKGQKKC